MGAGNKIKGLADAILLQSLFRKDKKVRGIRADRGEVYEHVR